MLVAIAARVHCPKLPRRVHCVVKAPRTRAAFRQKQFWSTLAASNAMFRRAITPRTPPATVLRDSKKQYSQPGCAGSKVRPVRVDHVGKRTMFRMPAGMGPRGKGGRLAVKTPRGRTHEIFSPPQVGHGNQVELKYAHVRVPEFYDSTTGSPVSADVPTRKLGRWKMRKLLLPPGLSAGDVVEVPYCDKRRCRFGLKRLGRCH